MVYTTHPNRGYPVVFLHGEPDHPFGRCLPIGNPGQRRFAREIMQGLWVANLPVFEYDSETARFGKGQSVAWRNGCRFYSRRVFRHPTNPMGVEHYWIVTNADHHTDRIVHTTPDKWEAFDYLGNHLTEVSWRKDSYVVRSHFRAVSKETVDKFAEEVWDPAKIIGLL